MMKKLVSEIVFDLIWRIPRTFRLFQFVFACLVAFAAAAPGKKWKDFSLFYSMWQWKSPVASWRILEILLEQLQFAAQLLEIQHAAICSTIFRTTIRIAVGYSAVCIASSPIIASHPSITSVPSSFTTICSGFSSTRPSISSTRSSISFDPGITSAHPVFATHPIFPTICPSFSTICSSVSTVCSGLTSTHSSFTPNCASFSIRWLRPATSLSGRLWSLCFSLQHFSISSRLFEERKLLLNVTRLKSNYADKLFLLENLFIQSNKIETRISLEQKFLNLRFC